MNSGGTNHIVLLYVEVTIGNGVAFLTFSPPVPFAFLQFDLQRVADGVKAVDRVI